MIKTAKYFFEAILIYSFFFIAKIIGLKFSRKVFSKIFKLVGPIIKSNNTAIKNLNRFSNNLSKKEMKDILDNMWSNYGMTFVEYIFLKKFNKENLHINIEGERFLEEIANNKKPVIFVSGHFANFELMSIEISKKKINLATIYRPLNNLFINPFMEYLRKKYICKNQIKKGISGVKYSIELIKKNYSIALMIDQRVSEGEKVNFFSEPCYTTTLPAQLALKFNLNIVPIFIERNNDNTFDMKIYEPLKSNQYNNKLEITKKLNEIMEAMISQNPNQWIWTHNRWKK